MRDKLLEAALDLLLSEGIQAFTQAGVAKRAGVRQSHLTYYFPTRSQLLMAVVEAGTAAVLQELGGYDVALPPDLALFRDRMAQHVSDTRMPRLMLALVVASEEDQALKNWKAELDAQFQSRMHEALLHYGWRTSSDELNFFHISLIGIAVQNLARSTPESATDAKKYFGMAFERLLASSSRVRASKTLDDAPAQARARQGTEGGTQA
ncbi:MAG: TetR/AcrR family transcriptional regulator [Burkholderiaceae bacterium]|nr:TetR/AcrR family transcriptional regulator [Burkholderiaceae bacterium]